VIGSCEKFLYGFQGGPPGRTRRRLGVQAYAHAAASAPAGPAPVGWRERQNTGRSTRSKLHCARGSSPLPLPDCPGPVRTCQGRLWPQGNRTRRAARRTYTRRRPWAGPARTRRWQLSEAGTRVARALTL